MQKVKETNVKIGDKYLAWYVDFDLQTQYVEIDFVPKDPFLFASEELAQQHAERILCILIDETAKKAVDKIIKKSKDKDGN
jgi:hypothetical protein